MSIEVQYSFCELTAIQLVFLDSKSRATIQKGFDFSRFCSGSDVMNYLICCVERKGYPQFYTFVFFS